MSVRLDALAEVGLEGPTDLERSQGRAPQPPVEEQEERLERARGALEAHELDGLLVWGSASANSDASAARLPCVAALRRSASTSADPSLSPGTKPPQRCATRSRACTMAGAAVRPSPASTLLSNR